MDPGYGPRLCASVKAHTFGVRQRRKNLLDRRRGDDWEDFPEDWEDRSTLIAVPTRRALDLGRDLAFDLIGQTLPSAFAEVQGIFHGRGV